MKYKLLWLLLYLAPLLSAHGASRSVDFSGLSEASREAVLKHVPALNSEFFTFEHLDQAVRYLMGTGRFDRVSVSKTQSEQGQIYRFLLEQSKIFSHLTVSGNQTLSTEQIGKLISLNKGDYFHQRTLKDIERTLLEEYQSRGYLQAQVRVSAADADERNVDIQVKVNEGVPCQITAVVVLTKNHQVKQIIEKDFSRYYNKILTANQIALIEKSFNEALLSHQYFGTNVGQLTPTLNPQKDEATITLRLEDVYEFVLVFRGNHYFSSSELDTAILAEESSSISLTLSPLQELSEKLRDFYRVRGFANVEIKSDLKVDDSTHRKIITFQVSEGSRVRIASIETTGRISQPTEFYDSFLREHGSETVRRGFFVRSDFNSTLKDLETELRNRGYLQAKILSFRTEFVNRGRAVNIALTIDEGPLTIVRRISYRNNKAFSHQQLDELLILKPNEPLRLKELADGLANIKQAYMNRGYLEVEIPDKNVVQYSRTGTQASLEISILEGPQISVGSIVVEGNTFTKEYVILNEISFQPGEILTPENIEDSITRLQRMGIFSRVNIRTLEQQSTVAQRTIIVSVTERDPGLLNFGMGFNSENEFTTRLYTGLSYRNINGTARAVSSRLELNSNIRTDQVEHKISLGYIEPYFFSRRTRGRTNLVQSREVTKFDTTTSLPYLHENTEIEFYVDREFGKSFKMLWKILGFGTTSDYLKGRTPELRNIARTGPIFELDYRDDLVNPTKGTLTRLTTEYSDPAIGSSSTVAYIKSTVGFTHYLSLANSQGLVWANSLRGGSLENRSQDPNGGVPEIENFYLGGRQTIRGFAYDERFPSDAELGVSTGEEFKLKTRSRFFLVKSELRFPLNDVLGLSFFYDGGGVQIDGLTFTDPYRDAVGCGLNFQTPVGPVNFEVGYKLDRKVNEEPFAIHLFSFGYF